MSSRSESTRGGDDVEDALRPGLVWGLKRSFISYVSRLPDFAHAETDGASLVRSSRFHFDGAEGSTYDAATGHGVLTFRGDVRLAGHGRLLYVMIADPWVEFGPERAVLSVVDIEHWPDRTKRMPLATLQTVGAPRTTATTRVWDEVRTFLAPEGQWVFNDQYPVGTELDPLTITVPR